MRAALRRLGPVVVVSVIALLVATCKGTEPRVATTVNVSGPTPLVSIGATAQYTAQVLDQKGKVLTGATVAWTTSNVAVITVDATTGIVTAAANGTAQVIATSGSAAGHADVTVAQAAAQVSAASGGGQSGTVGQALAAPLVVLVNDAGAHPAAGITVAFAVTSGGGSVGTPTATTDATGHAQTTWTLGTASGSQSVNATVAGASGSPVTFTATAASSAAASVTKLAGDNQSYVAGQAVPTAPSVSVKDQFNNPAVGVAVTFAVTAGGGSVTGASQTTNASGVATVGSWSLGPSGTQTLTATVAGSGVTGNPATFTATVVVAGAPASVAVLAGNNLLGLVGYATNVRPAVRVADAGNLPVSGVPVTFAVASGGGSATGLTTSTNGAGIAQVGSWTLGASAGVNTMTATTTGSGIAGNPVTFADTALTASYTIGIQYFGPAVKPAVKAAMDAAVAKWQQIIYRSVGAITINVPAGTCGPGTPALNQSVANLLIFATFDSIDGPSNIVGSAGPCLIRNSNGLTAVGVMVFDSSDVDTLLAHGLLDQVMLHEMAHVIGFGSLWGPPQPQFGVFSDCLQDTSAVGSPKDTYFSCAKGRAAFDSIGGTSYTGAGQTLGGNKVPVENCGNPPFVPPVCGQGAINGHWRETVFGTELMTEFITAGSNPLSVLSAAAQEDLGYTVNYAGADPYAHAFTAPVVGGAPPLALGDDMRHGPIYVLDRSGRVVATYRRN
jgi:hypothetical protein